MFIRAVTASVSLLFAALLAVTLNSPFLAILVLANFFAILATPAGSDPTIPTTEAPRDQAAT